MIFRVLLSVAALVLFLAPQFASAQSPTNNVLVALAPIDRKSPVELSALTLDATISEVNGHTFASGTSTFKVHNSDTANEITLPVGFPEWAGGELSFDPTKFSAFSVTVDNKKVPLTPSQAEAKVGAELRDVQWYTFDLKLQPDEKKLVTIDFTQDLGDSILPRFTYGMLPSTGWKGAINSARVTVKLPTPTSGEQFTSLDPTVPEFDGQQLTWLFTDFDPKSDPGVTFIRPSLWQNLLDRRAATVQKNDDATAHFQLGQVYQQLASLDSPRRDNFLAQAVAEFELASRLDPQSVDSQLTLAQLYEQRAGAAQGPRDANYVALAMAQWQKLVGSRADKDARQQLAEDSFYLGLSAFSRAEFDRALSYFDDAHKFSPDGAGPLYTPEHFQTELQTTRLAAARAQLTDGNTASALDYARAALGDKLDLSPAPPLPAFALNRASITTTSVERKLNLQLSPYPALSDQAKQALANVVNTLNQTNAGAAALSESPTSYTLTLTVPFTSDADLRARLQRLAASLPHRPDWDIVRAAIVPELLEYSEHDDTFSRIIHYREDVNLAPGQFALQSALNEMSRVIGEQSSASPDDNAAQLRLALLTDAQEWWHRALSSVAVTYEFQPSTGSPRDWALSAGETRSMAYDAETLRPELYFIGAGAAIGLVVLVVLTFIVFARLRRNTRNRHPQSL